MAANIVWKMSAGGLGGFMTDLPLGSNLFADLTADENATGGFDYRCAFLHNTGGDSYDQGTVMVDSDLILLGLDPNGIRSDVASVAVTINNSGESPVDVQFQDSPVILDSMLPGSCVAIWFRRTINPLQGNETVVFRLITEGV
jgi:hypothetical protein